MNPVWRFTRLVSADAAARALLLSLLVTPAMCAHAQQQPLPAQPRAPLTEQQDPLAGQPDPGNATPPPSETHASRQAPTELITQAAREPGTFIGKTLILHDGVSSKTVGPVKDLRRRLQDEELYLIVDATAYFNTPVEYAVAVRDLDRIEGDQLIIPETAGMHLNGLDYYPEDYADIDVTAPEAASGSTGQ